MSKVDITPSVTSDNYFAIIPEWILFSGISANAVRLYCVLNRHANKKGECFPTRKTLARELNVDSEKTVDRAMDELQSLGAVQIFHRRNGKEYTSNLYLVVTHNPKKVETSSTPGSPVDVEQIIAIKPKPLKDIQLDKVTQALQDFETFWAAYPRKDGKKNSRVSFNRAVKSASLAEILAGVARLVAEKREPKFIPLAASWLNGERWADAGVSVEIQAESATKIPPRMTSDEFIEPQGVKLSPERLKALRKALAGDSDEVEFP